jgi:hypothetical protein
LRERNQGEKELQSQLDKVGNLSGTQAESAQANTTGINDFRDGV